MADSRPTTASTALTTGPIPGIFTPTQDQIETLSKFKTALESLYDPQEHSDALLYRFLRARKFDIPKAKLMFSEDVTWRKEFNVARLLTPEFTFPEAPKVFAMYPRYYHKTDKLGRPVYIEVLTHLNPDKLLEMTTVDRLLQAYVREYEKLVQYRFPASSKKVSLPIEQGCTILDFKGVPISMFNSVRKLVQQVTGLASNHYPETMGKLFVINAPMLFTAVWSIVKNWLDEATVAKIQILGSSYQERLLEFIDAENLPVEFGGKCKCSGEGGCKKSDVGPWNDGSVEGYPIEKWEEMTRRDFK